MANEFDINKAIQLGSMAATGGTAQAVLGGAQAVYGLTQLPKAKREFERAKASAPSLDTPSQFYENYKNAYDAQLARMQTDAIQANLATSVQALQGAGGRALVGGLPAVTGSSIAAQTQMLNQERQARLAAGAQLAAAEDRTIQRKEQRAQQQMAYANQAYQAALGNIGGGLGSAGEGLMYAYGAKKRENKEQPPQLPSPPPPSPPEESFRGRSSSPFGYEPVGDGKFDPTTGANPFGEPLYPIPNPAPPITVRERGGMMTNGEFNHDTNPVHLIQNGEKVGEATGNEYILNPSQAKKIAKQSPFARSLFRRFERNAKKQK